MTPSTRGSAREQILPLFAGALGPPVVWAARIGTSYVLVPYACRTGGVLVLHLVTLIALVAVAALGAMAWRGWRAGRKNADGSPDRSARTRFLGLLGVLSSAFFFLVMVAEGLANFFVGPCQTAGAPIGW